MSPEPEPTPESPADPPPPPRPRRRVALAVALGVVLAVVGALVCAQCPTPAGPTQPAPRPGDWIERHQALVERAALGDVDLLFLGDSITEGWRGEPDLWRLYYAPRKAANFGIAADHTQHVLWRLDHGELDGIAPRAVVLLIGTNNLRTDTPAETAEGVTAVVQRLRAKLPRSKILLLGIFPRARTYNDPARIRLEAVNARLARLRDGKMIEYLDIGRHFLDDDGSLPHDVMPDYLHLSHRGYRIWAEAMEPKLREMLDGPTR